MLLTFTTDSLQRIYEGRKVTTIRRNPERWFRWAENGGKRLQVYWGNPRSGGRRICETRLAFLHRMKGVWMNDTVARWDGFDSSTALKTRLEVLHGIPFSDVLEMEWAIIGFDPWHILAGLEENGQVRAGLDEEEFRW